MEPYKEHPMRQFHHIGLVATEPKPGEMWFETLKVWGTDPSKDPNKIEWVRFTPESPLSKTPVAQMPHTSWRVDNLEQELKGKQVAVGPLTAAPGIRIAYFLMDGALIEYLEIKQ
jgi:hypothetical protein